MSIRLISSFDFLMIVLRLPQEKIAAKNPAISISCFFLKRCGMEIGSSLMKDGRLYSAAFLSKNSFRAVLVCTGAHFQIDALSDRLFQISDQIISVFYANA